MAKRKRRKKGLQAYAEEFAIALLYEASSGKIGKIKAPRNSEEESSVPVDSQVSFRDRRALLDSMTKLLGAQDAPDDDEVDGLEEMKERLNGRSGETTSGTDSSSDEDETGSVHGTFSESDDKI